jgi:VanZ family protein
MNKKVSWGIRFVYFVLPLIVFAAAIFYMSSLGNVETPLTFHLSDKFLHMLAYSLFGWLLIRALHFGRREPISKKLLFIAVLIGAFYGLTDEFHQYFVPGRHSEFLDWLADAIGVFLGAELYRRLHRFEMQIVQFASKSLS